MVERRSLSNRRSTSVVRLFDLSILARFLGCQRRRRSGRERRDGIEGRSGSRRGKRRNHGGSTTRSTAFKGDLVVKEVEFFLTGIEFSLTTGERGFEFDEFLLPQIQLEFPRVETVFAGLFLKSHRQHTRLTLLQQRLDRRLTRILQRDRLFII